MVMIELKINWIYKHTKSWKMYKIIWIWKHTETLEQLVIYEALYDNKDSKIWCRPIKMFIENIEINWKQEKRFEYVEMAGK